jgi:hypothetical protein
MGVEIAPCGVVIVPARAHVCEHSASIVNVNDDMQLQSITGFNRIWVVEARRSAFRNFSWDASLWTKEKDAIYRASTMVIVSHESSVRVVPISIIGQAHKPV